MMSMTKKRRRSSSQDGSLSLSNNNNNNNNKKKNKTLATKKSITTAKEDDDLALCSFCGQVPAAMEVQVPVLLRRQKRVPRLYCLTCYYSTSAVRQGAQQDSSTSSSQQQKQPFVSIFHNGHVQEQLPAMQDLFNEAYIDLKKQLAEESEKAFQQQKTDPLAMLFSAPSTSQKRKSVPSKNKNKKAGNLSDGGFLRTAPVPERFLQTQQQQQQQQSLSRGRPNPRTNGSSSSTTTTTRRTSSTTTSSTAPAATSRRKNSNIWNLAMANPKKVEVEDDDMLNPGFFAMKCPSCGNAKTVQAMGHMTSRNQDLKKGETWGMKDRGDEVVTRYHCQACGKMWNEEE